MNTSSPEAPKNYFGTPTRGDYTVAAVKVYDRQYAFRIIQTAPCRVDGITVQQVVIDQSERLFDDRDIAIAAGIAYVESLFDPHKTFSQYERLAGQSPTRVARGSNQC